MVTQSVDTNHDYLAPDFTTIALSDEETISKALDIALSANNKSSYYQSEEYNNLVMEINDFANGDTVGCLRVLSNDQWDVFMQDSDHNTLPLLCKMYLKRLIIQSQRLTKQQILECDFNLGLRFQWSSLENKLSTLMSLGVSRYNAMEAIMVIKHQPDNEGQKLDLLPFQKSYLEMNEISKKIMYDKAKKNRNQFVPYKYHWTILEATKQENKKILQWQKMTSNELWLEIQKLKDDLNKFKMKRIKLNSEVDEMRYQRKMILYSECIRGVIGDQVVICDVDIFIAGCIRKQQITMTQIIPHEINGVILLYFGEVNRIPVNSDKKMLLERYKHRQKLTYMDHIKVLNKLGYTEIMFCQFRNYQAPIEICIAPDECVLCYEPQADYMVLPCCHVCLCGDCADDCADDMALCPLCNLYMQDIKQVFYF
eukprot:424066_1